MRVLLVEPAYRTRSVVTRKQLESENNSSGRKRDESLWYPPIGLLKLATFHKQRGDHVKFVSGYHNEEIINSKTWDRVYITTLFTFGWKKVIETVNFYKSLLNDQGNKIFVGGIMASILPDAIYNETGIKPIEGVLHSSQSIRLKCGTKDIDLLPPDYGILDSNLYAINETYYGYTTRGCINKCPWCGVPKIEPDYVPYIDIKDMIEELRRNYGDKPVLKLMDNNVLASPYLEQIVEDLLELGYGRNDYTKGTSRRRRSVDFNQGLDATFVTETTMKLVSKLELRPMRIAFDRIAEKDQYLRAVEIAHEYGVKNFSNYMLYNWKDSPKDLYDRLSVNNELNERWRDKKGGRTGCIYSYPMRYAPVGLNGTEDSRQRDRFEIEAISNCDSDIDSVWTRRFARNIEIMKGAAYGAISSTPELARRCIGETYEEFMENLYMPEVMLRNRDKYEKRVYDYKPDRAPGTGDLEAFRTFLRDLIQEGGSRFDAFNYAVSQNSRKVMREFLTKCDDETKKWVEFYIM